VLARTHDVRKTSFSAATQLNDRGTGELARDPVVGRTPGAHPALQHATRDVVCRQELRTFLCSRALRADHHDVPLSGNLAATGVERPKGDVVHTRDLPLSDLIGLSHVQEVQAWIVKALHEFVSGNG
jgi:hypothetical protein